MAYPTWRKLQHQANRLRDTAKYLESYSDQLRCEEMDSGGARCTADNIPNHKHQVDEG